MQSFAVPVMTLEQAKRQMREKSKKKGSSCPCCGRLVKLYRRKLSAEMSVFLIALCREFVGELIDIRRMHSWRYQRGDFAYLAHWGLVETGGECEPRKRGSAMWRPTQKGIDFVARETLVPSHIHMLCGELLGFAEHQVGIKDTLGSEFDYDELMAPAGVVPEIQELRELNGK